ncbi:MAG: lamin tail domain-containing protein [Polyangia bacterium]
MSSVTETFAGQIVEKNRNRQSLRNWLIPTITLLFTVGCSEGDASTLDAGSEDLSVSAQSVVINELYPHGTDTLTDPDWVELKNLGQSAVNLSGYRVRDDKTFFTLPAQATIPAGGYLILYCDDAPDGGASDRVHLPFKLGSQDEFYLLDPSGATISSASWNAVTAPSEKSYGRLPDGTGLFIALTPTRSARNI